MRAGKWWQSLRELDLIKCLPCTWVLTANQEALLWLNMYCHCFSLTLQICWEVHIPDALGQIIALKEGSTGVAPAGPHQDECSFFPRFVLNPSHTHFHEEHSSCQLHCRLSPDNLLTSRILECQPGCLYNCCLCQSLCEKCHQENEVRKQSCRMLLMEVTRTESITCFQDSFENIFSSWEKRHL